MTAVSEAETSATAARSPFREPMAGDQTSAGAADDTLRHAVLARLIAHPLVRAGHICVVNTAGAVTLFGYVTSNAQKEAAIAAARRVEGVDQVVDDLRVALPRPAETGPQAQALEVRPLLAATRTIRTFDTTPSAATGVVRPGPRP